MTRPLAESLTQHFSLTPLKCSMDTEPPSFGSVAWVVKAPGKTASKLGMSWNCAHDGCGVALELLYRRAQLARIECAGSQ